RAGKASLGVRIAIIFATGAIPQRVDPELRHFRIFVVDHLVVNYVVVCRRQHFLERQIKDDVLNSLHNGSCYILLTKRTRRSSLMTEHEDVLYRGALIVESRQGLRGFMPQLLQLALPEKRFP